MGLRQFDLKPGAVHHICWRSGRINLKKMRFFLINLYPECSEGLSFYFWGSWSGEAFSRRAFAFATVRNRRQPSAARPQVGPYGRAYSHCCKSDHFRWFQTSRILVSCGRRGTSWHCNMFHSSSKVILCDRRNTFEMIFRRWAAFFVAGAALWRPAS